MVEVSAMKGWCICKGYCVAGLMGVGNPYPGLRLLRCTHPGLIIFDPFRVMNERTELAKGIDFDLARRDFRFIGIKGGFCIPAMKLIPFYKGYCVAGLGMVAILTLGYASLTQGYEYLTRSGSPVGRKESAPILPDANY